MASQELAIFSEVSSKMAKYDYKCKNLKQSIQDYLNLEENTNLPHVIKAFHSDILSKILWENQFGLNYLSMDFLKILMKNRENLSLEAKLELLHLLKTIKFNHSLVPAYFYNQINEFIQEIIMKILKNLEKSNKNLQK